MEEVVRHFMAPKLGRGIVRARITSDGSVSIDLELDPSVTEHHHIRLHAGPACPKPPTLSGVKLLYRMSRYAISQVQRHIRDKTLCTDQLELTCTLKPWNGDLTELPYGGATNGCLGGRVHGGATKIMRIAMAHLGYRGRSGAPKVRSD